MMEQWRLIWRHLDGHRGQYLLLLAMACIFPFMLLINPNISRILVDRVVVGTTGPGGETVRQMELLFPLCLAMVGVTLVRTALGYAIGYLGDYTAQCFLVSLRNRLYAQLQVQSPVFYDSIRTGDLMTRMTGDLDIMRHNVSFVFRNLLSNSLLFLGVTFFFITISLPFTLCLCAVSVAVFFTACLYFKKIKPYYVMLREKLSRLNICAQENIEGNRVVKAFAREDFEREKFDERNASFRDANIKTSLIWQNYYPIIEGLSQQMTVITLLVGGTMMMNGLISAGDLTAFMGLTWAMSGPLVQLGVNLNDLQRFFASSEKIIELYYHRPDVKNPKNGFTGLPVSDPRSGEVSFDDVTFSIHKTTVLEHISFTARRGQTIGIMGVTGAGKTTIANLVTRLLDVRGGSVAVDGVDVRKWDLQALRRHIGIATQDVFLFSDSVDGNISYGVPDLSMEDVELFARKAGVDFVSKLSDGYDTLIGERGVGLSGGQKQRIALARALAKRPGVLILDDTTSAVDLETERAIQEELRSLDFSCTKIIIAQRISSVQDADIILVLRDHKISEAGTHRELIGQRGYYYDIWRIQTGLGTAESEVAL